MGTIIIYEFSGRWAIVQLISLHTQLILIFIDSRIMLWYFVIFLITFGYLWLKYRYSYWERHGVAGPKPIFFFGNLIKSVTLQEHYSIAYHSWYNAFTDLPYIGFYKLLKPAVFIRDPELQREILVKAFANFHENDANAADEDDLRKTSPFFLNGEKWQRSRAFFGSLFSPNKFRKAFPRMLEVGKEWEQYVRRVGKNAELDAKDVSLKIFVLLFVDWDWIRTKILDLLSLYDWNNDSMHLQHRR